MKFRTFISNFFLLSLSIAFGIFISELIGKNIGLGDPILYKEDNLVGYRLRPNQSKKRLNNANVSSDEEGFRFNPSEDKSLFADIIVFVGDSVTYGGSTIDNSELFSTLYCDENKNLLCLNSGLNSWGTYNMGRFISNFSLYSSRVPQKFVLVITPGDDLRNLAIFRGLPFWNNSPKKPKAINELINYSLLKYVIPNLRSKEKLVSINKYDVSKFKINQQTKIHAWEDLNNYLKLSNYDVDIVVTPPKAWFEKTEEFKYQIKSYDQFLYKIEKNKKVKNTCNLYYLIKDKYSPEDYLDHHHLSKKGHKKWAKNIKLCLN